MFKKLFFDFNIINRFFKRNSVFLKIDHLHTRFLSAIILLSSLFLVSYSTPNNQPTLGSTSTSIPPAATFTQTSTSLLTSTPTNTDTSTLVLTSTPIFTPTPEVKYPPSCIDQDTIDQATNSFFNRPDIQKKLKGFTNGDVDDPTVRQKMIEKVWQQIIITHGVSKAKVHAMLDEGNIRNGSQEGILIGHFFAQINGGKSNCAVMLASGKDGKPIVTSGILDFESPDGKYYRPSDRRYIDFGFTTNDLEIRIGNRVDIIFKVTPYKSDQEMKLNSNALTYFSELLGAADYTGISMDDINILTTSGKPAPTISLADLSAKLQAKFPDTFKGVILPDVSENTFR
jgi:hypothetical protein